MTVFCVSKALAALNVGDLDLRLQHMQAFGDLLEAGQIIAIYEPHDSFAGFVDATDFIDTGLPMLTPAHA